MLIEQVAIQQFGSVPDRIFAWLPLYSVLRALVITAFLLSRATMSESLYASFVQPAVKRYEARIDLTLLLLHSIGRLLFHFVIRYPLERVRISVEALIGRSRRLAVRDHLSASEDTVIDMTFGSVDDDAPSVSASDLPPAITCQVMAGVVRREVDRSKLASPQRASSSSIPAVQRLMSGMPDKLPTRPKAAGPSRRAAVESSAAPDVRVKRSTAPTPDSIATLIKSDVFDDDNRASASVKRKAPPSPPPRHTAVSRDVPASNPPKAIRNPKTNALQQPPRRLPTRRDANVIPTAKPLQKSKSTVELAPSKPSLSAQQAARPVKSAPTRRPAVLATASTASDLTVPSRRIPTAADRARVMRDAKRKEEAVEIGEKRKPVRSIGPPGSKRTKVHVDKD